MRRLKGLKKLIQDMLYILKSRGPYGGAVQRRQLSIHPWLLFISDDPLRSLAHVTTEQLKYSLIANMSESEADSSLVVSKTLAELDALLSPDELDLLDSLPKCRISTKMAAVCELQDLFYNSSQYKSSLNFVTSIRRGRPSSSLALSSS